MNIIRAACSIPQSGSDEMLDVYIMDATETVCSLQASFVAHPVLCHGDVLNKLSSRACLLKTFMHFIGWKPPICAYCTGQLDSAVHARANRHTRLASRLRGIGEAEQFTVHAVGGCRFRVER